MSPVDDRDHIALKFRTLKCAPCAELGHECWANAEVDGIPMCTFCEAGEPCLKQVKAPDDFMVATPAGNGPVRHVDPKDVEVAPVTVNASSWHPPEKIAKVSKRAAMSEEESPAVKDWNDYAAEINGKKETETTVTPMFSAKPCKKCGKTFQPTGAAAKFCDNCKPSAHKAKPKVESGPKAVGKAVASMHRQQIANTGRQATPVRETKLTLEISERNLDAFLLTLPLERKLEIVQDALRLQ
jgi:hypothetical protein